MSSLVVLTILVILVLLYSPLYLLLRARMTSNTVMVDREPDYYRLTRAARITLLLFSVGIVALGIMALLFYSVLLRGGIVPLQRLEISLVTAFGFVNFLIIFGIGIYASAIVTEQFTLNTLKSMEDFVPLRRLNDFYHGPFSHLLVFSGSPILFWIIAVAEQINVSPTSINGATFFTYVIYGLLFGALYGYIQIKNYTWRYQQPFALATLFGYLIYWVVAEPDHLTMPVNYFFLMTLLTFNAVLTIYWLYHRPRLPLAILPIEVQDVDIFESTS